MNADITHILVFKIKANFIVFYNDNIFYVQNGVNSKLDMFTKNNNNYIFYRSINIFNDIAFKC